MESRDDEKRQRAWDELRDYINGDYIDAFRYFTSVKSKNIKKILSRTAPQLTLIINRGRTPGIE